MVRKQTEKSGKTGGKTPIPLEGMDKILYDLVKGSIMPRRTNSPTVEGVEDEVILLDDESWNHETIAPSSSSDI